MAKKSKYKKVYKGVRYITDKLLYYYPKRFKTRKEASEQAHAIYSELKASKTKVTIKSAFNLLPKKKGIGKKRNAPELDPELLDLKNYWLLEDYVLYISRMSSEPNLLFVSDIIPSGLEDLMAGYEYDYGTYFKPFVDYIDKIRKDLHQSMYMNEWYVTCTTPVFNKNKKVWVSKIISCDSEGNEVDYGFDKNNPEFSIITDIYEPKKEIKEVEKKEDKTKPKEVDKEISIEREKQNTLQKEIELTKARSELADKAIELAKAGFSKAEIMKILGL